MGDLPERLRAMAGPHVGDLPILLHEAADNVERLRYVLGGVRSAIKTGQNEPLQIWLDQINIALEEADQ